MLRVYLDPERVTDETGKLLIRYREIYLKDTLFRVTIDDDGFFIECHRRHADLLKTAELARPIAPEVEEPVSLTPDAPESSIPADPPLDEEPDFGPTLKEVLPPLVVRALHGHGFQTFEDMRGMTQETLIAIKGVGPASAKKILEVLG